MRPRPRVHLEVPQATDHVRDVVASALEDSPVCTGGATSDSITLRLHPDRRQPWSPWLQLRVTPSEKGTQLEGHMGPAPELWTAFVFIYSLGVAGFIAGSMFGLVQLNLGQTPTGLWGVVVSLSVLALSCGADLTGRRIGQGQMGVLRGFLRRALPDAVDMDAEAPEANGSLEPA